MRQHLPYLSFFTILLSSLPAHAFGPTCAAPPVVSRFWERLDSLCARTNQLVGPDAAQVVAYCDTKAPPAFAADSDQDRLNRTANLLSSVGLPTPPPYLISPPTPNELLDSAARSLISDDDLEMGAIGNYLSYQFLFESCDAIGAPQWAHATCSKTGEGQALIDLRRHIVQDIASIPSSYLAENAPKMPPAVAQKLRLVAAILDTIAQSIDLANLAKRMVTDTVSDLRNAVANPCALRDPGDSPLRNRVARANGKVDTNPQFVSQLPGPPPSVDPVVLAGRVLERLLQDGPSLNRSPAYYTLVIERTIQVQRRIPTFSLNPLQKQAAATLIDAIRLAEQAKGALAAGRNKSEALRLLGQAFIRAVESSVTLTIGVPTTLPPELFGTIEALAIGNIEAAAQSCLALIPSLPQLPAIPSGSVRLLVNAAKLARVRSEADAVKLLASQFIPVGPWSDKYLFALNGAAAKLDAGKIGFSGDFGLGYQERDWGGFVQAKGDFYRLSSNTMRVDSRRGGGSLDAWGVVAGDRPFAMELRGTVGVAGERSQNTDFLATTDSFFTEDKAFTGRAQLLAGVRYRPDLRFAFGLWLGGGASYERVTHTYLMDQGSIDVNAVKSTSGIFSGRLRAQWLAVPGWFAVRFRGDGSRTTIKRTSLAIQLSTAGLNAENTLSSFTQLELSSRVFLDAEVAKLMGFVPSVYGGVDYFSQSGESGTVSATIPVVGAGIRREVF